MIDFDSIKDFLVPENITKEKVVEIESEIKSFYKCYDDFIDLMPLTQESDKKLATLFYKRRYVLNGLFKETQENLARLQKVSAHLKFLSAKMFERVKAMKEKINLICDDPDFDDDCEIEATLSFSYNDEDSVLRLPDDDYYGSDFQFMLLALSQYYDEKSRFDCILDIGPDSENLDEKLNWNISPLNFPQLNICYATHCVCDHHDYSIPDLIRMNDFWTEIKFTEQSLTDQAGKRCGRWSDNDNNN